MRDSGNTGLPPRALAGLLAAIVLLVAGVPLARLMQRRPVPLVEATAPGSEPPAPDTADGHNAGFDPELYRVPLGFLEEALYGTGGVDRIAEASQSLARAVMAKNVTNPLARNVVMNLQARLDRLTRMDADKAGAAREWEAIRREYFRPASWLHAPSAPVPQ